jgi:hypothetical protein
MRHVLWSLVVVLLALGGCKKKEEASNPVADAVQAVGKAATTAAGGAAECECPTCPECPACPACPEPVAAAPTGPVAAALGADPSKLAIPVPPGFTFEIATLGEYEISVKAEGKDPKVRLYKGDQAVAEDDDGGGEDRSCLLFAWLEPGTYTAFVNELGNTAADAMIRVAQAAPLPSAGTVKPGEPLEVQVPAATNERSACAEMTLEIAEAGNYRLDAVGGEGIDAQLILIKDSHVVATDSDSGGDNNARIEQAFEAGTYVVRVHDWRNNVGTITVSVAAP